MDNNPQVPTVPFDRKELDQARLSATYTILRLAESLGGPDALVTEPIYRGARTDVQKPRPLAGVKAAVLLRSAALHELREHAARARAAGITWTQLAKDGGMARHDRDEDEPPSRLARKAFDQVASFVGSRDYDPVFTWYCGTCDGQIREPAPDSGEQEQGHHSGCERLVAEQQTGQATWDDEDEDVTVPTVNSNEWMLTDWVAKARRARSLGPGESWPPWSTGETLAVALILQDDDRLGAMDYTETEALDRLRYDVGLASVQEAAELFGRLRETL